MFVKQQESASWTSGRIAGALALMVSGIVVCRQDWADIWQIAWGDEEASHVLLVPIVVGWLIWSRQEQIRRCRLGPSMVGPIIIALGWLMSYWGFYHSTQSFRHGGAVVVLVGCLLSIVGLDALRRFWPAFLVLIFLIPVPGMVRQRIAIPLQDYTATATGFVCQLLDMDVLRSGSVLWYNDIPVNVAEACNGMRMVFTLLLVSLAFAFASPIRNWVKALVVAASPVTAIGCNVMRLVPTLWFYGNYSEELSEKFHDATGWAMLVLALGLLMGMVRLLHWAQIPVMALSAPSANQHTSTPKMQKPMGANILVVLVALVMLVGNGITSARRPRAADAEPFHARVRQIVSSMPQQIGDWYGTDVEAPAAAVKLLKPNVLVSRIYKNILTGGEATLLLVQCKDVRYMVGHYPPVCYRAHGYSQDAATPAVWRIDDMEVRGTEYVFSQRQPSGTLRMNVANFLILPNGQFAADMKGVRQAEADYTRRYHGAAQMQLVSSSDLSDAQRHKIFEQIIGANAQIVRTLLGGDISQTRAGRQALSR